MGIALVGLAAAAWWGVGRSPRPDPPRNVLLITVDTLRADAVGAFGGATAATPWMDRLAAGGVRFTAAHAHNVVTLPSHANILTGRLPTDHGVRDNAGFRLSPEEATLATHLKARGFQTAAFISAFPLDSRFGLARGFDVYDDAFVDAAPRPAFLEQERAAPRTVEAAVQWIQGRRTSGPWLAWVHLYEPHYPYAAPDPFGARFPGNPYAAEVAAADAALEPLVRPILDAGAAGDTLVVVTSDHGESLGDHGEATHGIFAYEATLRVPLVVYYPALFAPRSIERPASHVDIAPTVYDALGVPSPAGLRGRSLIDLIGRSAAEDPIVYFEALSGSLNRGWAPLTGIIAGGLKYIDLPIPELYDLRLDAAETRNLVDARRADVDARRELLRSFATPDIRRVDESAEVKARLRTLGYVSSGMGTTRKHYTDADDPKRLIAVETELQDILGLYLGGNLADALTRGRTLVARHPDMRLGLLQLAHLERESGNLPSAIDALRRALALHPGDAEAASLLGAYLTSADRSRDAIALLEPFAAQAGADPQVQVSLALALGRSGRFADAVGVLDRARKEDPTNAMLCVTLGTVHLMGGQRAQARAAFEAALAINANLARAHSSLGALLAEEGRHDDSLQHWQRALALDPNEHEKLLAVAIGLARADRAADARPYFQLFVASAPAQRFAADVAKAQDWLRVRQ